MANAVYDLGITEDEDTHQEASAIMVDPEKDELPQGLGAGRDLCYPSPPSRVLRYFDHDSEVPALKAKVAKLEEDSAIIARMSAANEQNLSAQVSVLKDEVSVLEKADAIKADRIAELEALLTELRAHLDDSKEDGDAKAAKIAELEAQLGASKEDGDSKAARIAELQDQVSASEKDGDSKAEQIAALEAKVESLENDLEKTTKDCDDVVANAEVLRERSGAEMEALRSKLDQQDQYIGGLTKELNEMVPRDAVEAKDEHIAALTKQVEELGSEIAFLRDSRSDFEAQFHDEVGKLAAALAERDRTIVHLERLTQTHEETLERGPPVPQSPEYAITIPLSLGDYSKGFPDPRVEAVCDDEESDGYEEPAEPTLYDKYKAAVGRERPDLSDDAKDLLAKALVKFEEDYRKGGIGNVLVLEGVLNDYPMDSYIAFNTVATAIKETVRREKEE